MTTTVEPALGLPFHNSGWLDACHAHLAFCIGAFNTQGATSSTDACRPWIKWGTAARKGASMTDMLGTEQSYLDWQNMAPSQAT